MVYTEVKNVISKSSDLEGFDCWPEQDIFVFFKMFGPVLGLTVYVYEWVPEAALGCVVARE